MYTYTTSVVNPGFGYFPGQPYHMQAPVSTVLSNEDINRLLKTNEDMKEALAEFAAEQNKFSRCLRDLTKFLWRERVDSVLAWYRLSSDLVSIVILYVNDDVGSVSPGSMSLVQSVTRKNRSKRKKSH